MKTTNSKDLVKVNQILPIMQEHFGQSMNLARIKLMALLLHALCVVQTVSLHKLADAMPTAVDKDSNLRRLQRFFAKYVLDLDIIARMIFSLLPVKTGLVLSMDRTNWKFGEFNINILMLGITYKGIAFPLIFSLLSKRGNSNWEERKKIMERFIRLFGAECIRLPCGRPRVHRKGMDRMAQQPSHTVLHPNTSEFLDCQAFHR